VRWAHRAKAHEAADWMMIPFDDPGIDEIVQPSPPPPFVRATLRARHPRSVPFSGKLCLEAFSR